MVRKRFFCLAFLGLACLPLGCNTDGSRSALMGQKMKYPYPVRLRRARDEQLRQSKARNEPVVSVLQKTEDSLREAIRDIFDGREAEIRGDRSHPLADVGMRQWRVEELVLFYHPHISLDLQMLDHRAANPNLIVAVLNSVRLAGSAGVTRGAVSTRTGAEETLDWILNEDQRTVYNADARAQVGLEGYIKDAKTKMLFEMDLLKFRNRLLVEHGKVWPLVEGYTAVNPEDRARRSEALLEEILWRPLKTK